MNGAEVMDVGRDALWLTIQLCAPVLLVGLVVGVVIGLVQALTQIQEQTLSFGVKLVSVALTLLLTARWVGGEMYNFTLQIFDVMPLLGK